MIFKNSKKNTIYISVRTPNKKKKLYNKKNENFKYFKKICGSPKSKIQHIKKIKRKKKIKLLYLLVIVQKTMNQ